MTEAIMQLVERDDPALEVLNAHYGLAVMHAAMDTAAEALRGLDDEQFAKVTKAERRVAASADPHAETASLLLQVADRLRRGGRA